MVYKYKRKTNQAQWSEDSMMLAIADCNSGIPVKTTAKKYGLPYATLYRHWKKGSSTAQLGRFRKVFNDEQEGDLRTYLYDMDSVFYGLTREDFKTLVFEYAKRNNVTYPPSWDKNKKAGDDWLAGFMRRNPQITLRTPDATSIGRVKGFNRPQVERFYKLLSEQIDKCRIDGTRIFNVDETGIQTSTNKPPKVLSVKGKKQVGVISSTERGQTTTVVCCCNASGSFVPPFMIFARKRMQDRLLDGSPPETRGSCSASGWINGEIFLDWLNFLLATPAYLKSATPNNAIKGFQSTGIWPTNKDIWGEEDYAPSSTTMTDRNTTDQQEIIIDSNSQDVEITIDIEKSSTSGLQSQSLQIDVEPLEQIQREFIENVNVEVEDAVENSIMGIESVSNKKQISSRGTSPSILVELPDKDPLTCNVVVVTAVTDNTQKLSRQQEAMSPEDIMNQGADLTQDSIEIKKDQFKGDDENIKDLESCTARPLAYFSPKDIRPLPMPHVSVGTRKRKVQKSEVLTSTPVKREQKEKFIKINAKAMKNMNIDLNAKPKTAIKKNTKTTENIIVKKSKDSGKENEEEQCVCYYCGENYIEINKKPVDDWIQCDKCKQWSHEKCTAYEGIGLFFCDICTD
ncbi:unnamed protein product [Euphydryas editha]|uniref:Zinc finger PHD-type domain-containing protein n=1 Tax=Euphydryas editha TaxID=104508 RepID=A0AAU9UAP1_EUPED|nr:unnamed protein product [Euphydryas editha]